MNRLCDWLILQRVHRNQFRPALEVVAVNTCIAGENDDNEPDWSGGPVASGLVRCCLDFSS